MAQKPRKYTGNSDLLATAEQRPVVFGAAQKGKKDRK
jgi:hypothetical protein